jgi:methylmalonyl-CoA decarboxylase
MPIEGFRKFCLSVVLLKFINSELRTPHSKLFHNLAQTPAPMSLIKKEIKDNIGTICFNNDEKRNSLSAELMEEFYEAFDLMEAKKVRVIILRANAGVRVWCAGLNIKELPEPGNDPIFYHHPLEKIMRRIQKLPVPVIAMIDGSVWGGGCDLSFVCDILIGTKNASFAITPAKIGVPYNTTGIVHFLNMVDLNIAKEMFFTARPIGAEKAENLGILNHLVEEDKLESFTYDMAGDIASNSPLSIAVIKEQLNIMGAAKPINSEFYEIIDELRQKAFNSNDYREGIKAFYEKRKPKFTGE